ncbi:proton-conducting transporter transmembrane domain-containing protein [Rickettsia rickettsii]|uniref:Putative monovalent cation/H+ antiporter subunit D n=1 Tax=Rickettsia rickettsii (strain Sheila Smith) TaxID=392021 RepID=A0A0H3AXM1_RICRS|nr:proton-conducting transporter membrane subunit [Rickettsia rickettsii]ABV75989.1 putative monovalent cation/H+ antiporter subunit D [Rickettsia rickettsii str. 'Sheila Smith']AFB22442.1 putative monovalent cation/H+ antiporter subunit D [Rickettsia rickettsii str. Brazil]AJG32856.1 cation:proton antiporter [Rickettsia rickettsii str. R]USD87120.1 cation:proton antiporter [Rickettsia rickettsii]USD88436.1 cation:proton antiporter [Rickettsia rickettsii]
MFIQNTKCTFPLTNFELIFDFHPQNQLIALAFLIVTAILNLYTISQNRKLECLIGSLYCLSSIICVFAADFISMIISLEFMTIFACIIIFCDQLKIKPARQYFLTHLFSSGLILIGMTLLIQTTSNTTFTSLTASVNNFELPAIFILAGCLINASAIFVNGWVVHCYPIASSSGIVYLISFTTKVILIIILKLFSGLEILKFFGISMIIYGLVLSLIEKKLKRLICYLTVSQLGFILTAISINSPNIAYLITSFIFIHILYNGLFALYFAYIEDEYDIKNYQDLQNTQINFILLSGFVISILIYTSILPISSSYIKDEIANILNENSVMLFSKIATCTILFGLLMESSKSFPSRFMSFLRKQESRNIIKLLFLRFLLDSCFRRNDIRTITYLSFCIITLCICLFYPIQISHTANFKLVILAISLLLALIFRKIPRISTENINLDLYQYIEKFIYFSIDKYKETADNNEDAAEYLNFKVIWDNIFSKISAWHNQQTAILIVLFLLISLILTLQ